MAAPSVRAANEGFVVLREILGDVAGDVGNVGNVGDVGNGTGA